MTALGSANSAKSGGVFYKFLPYYLNKLRFLKPQLIMNSIFALLSYPLAGGFMVALASVQSDIQRLHEQKNEMGAAAYEAAVNAAYRNGETLQSLATMSIVIGVLCLVGLFVFTFVTTLRAFRYLYDKTAVDMDYSLPVNHNTRFLGDLSAVLTTSILPHLIAVFIGMILLNIIIGIVEPLGFEPGTWPLIRDLIYQGMFVGLFACVMQLAFSLMMISFCGRKAEAFLYPVLINIAVPFIHIMGIYIVESNIFGSSFNIGEVLMPATATSPVGMVFVSFYSIFDITGMSHIEGYNTTLPIFRAEFLIPAILLTLVFFAGAYFLIKYRRNERVGMPYVYKGISVVIPGVILLAVSLPMWNMVFYQFSNAMRDDYSYTPNSAAWLIGLLISTFILYVIMELISGRNFKKFHISVLKWACTIAATAGIAALLIFTNGFGRAGYIPETNSVAYVDMDIQESDGDYTQFRLTEATDDEVINAIREVHKKVLDDKPVHDPTEYSVKIDYTLNSGEVVGRFYWLTQEQFNEIVKLAVTPATAYQSLVYKDLEIPLNHESWRLTEIGAEDNRVRTNEITLDELNAALKKDLENITSDDIFGSKPGNISYNVYIAFDMGKDNDIGDQILYVHGRANEFTTYIEIYGWMDNTLDYLASHGVTVDLSRFRTAFLLEFEDEDSDDHYKIDHNIMMALSDGKMTDYVREIADRYLGNDYMIDNAAIDILPYSFGELDVDSAAYSALLEGAYGNGYQGKYALCLCTEESYDYFHSNYSIKWLSISDEYYNLAESLLENSLVYEYNGETDWITAYGKFVDFDALKGTQSAGTGEAA